MKNDPPDAAELARHYYFILEQIYSVLLMLWEKGIVTQPPPIARYYPEVLGPKKRSAEDMGPGGTDLN